MLRYFHLTSALYILSTLLPGTALGHPVSVRVPYATASSSNSESFVCYIQAEDGTITNLDALCTKNSADSKTSQTSSMSRSRQCYFVDADGLPCKVVSRENQGGAQTR